MERSDFGFKSHTLNAQDKNTAYRSMMFFKYYFLKLSYHSLRVFSALRAPRTAHAASDVGTNASEQRLTVSATTRRDGSAPKRQFDGRCWASHTRQCCQEAVQAAAEGFNLGRSSMHEWIQVVVVVCASESKQDVFSDIFFISEWMNE